MARESVVSHETFEEILAWLNPDREVAGAMYVQLRHDLAKLFVWGRCGDPEGLTDEVFDRVAKKVHDVRTTYEGDPRLYFRAVANNLIKENFKRLKTYVSLDEVDLSKRQTSETNERTVDMEECLQLCLQGLGTEQREMILAYYAKEKQAKIDHRSLLAQRFGISIKTLRVKVFRIRLSLEESVERCLRGRVQRK